MVTPMADVEEARVQLAGRMLLGAPVLLALICGAAWVLVGYALHTVDRMRRQVAELSVTGLDRRVDVPVARDDPILHVRRAAYAVSFAQRSGTAGRD